MRLWLLDVQLRIPFSLKICLDALCSSFSSSIESWLPPTQSSHRNCSLRVRVAKSSRFKLPRRRKAFSIGGMKCDFKCVPAILVIALCNVGASHTGVAQQTVLTTDPTLAIPKVEFDAKGDLKTTASATSSPSDFDFLVGKWKMHN